MEPETRKRIVYDILALNNLSIVKLIQQTSSIVPSSYMLPRDEIIDAFICAKYGSDGIEWVEESHAVLPKE